MNNEKDQILDAAEAPKQVIEPSEQESPQEPQEEPSKEVAPDAPEKESSEVSLRKHLGIKDGEDLHGKALDHIKSLQDYKDNNESVNSKLLEVFETQPEIGSFLKDIVNGAPVNVAIAKNFDVESLKAQDGDPDYDEWNKAIEGRKKTLAEKQKYLKEIDDNVKMSAKELEAFTKENKLSDEDAEDFLKGVDQLVADLVRGKVTKDALTRFYKGINYDKDIKEQTKVAEVKGKNTKIEELKKKEESKVGDGIPKLKAQNKVETPKPQAQLDPFSQAIESHLKRNKI